MMVNQQPRIVTLRSMQVIGMTIRATPSDMMTPGLWRSFGPRRKEIKNAIDNVLYSIQVFDELPGKEMHEVIEYTKWAAVEVSTLEFVPEGMQTLEIPEGQYAVFVHEGLSDNFHETVIYIFETWLPSSGFALSHRPHLARMDDRYLGPNDPRSLEEIYVPIE